VWLSHELYRRVAAQRPGLERRFVFMTGALAEASRRRSRACPTVAHQAISGRAGARAVRRSAGHLISEAYFPADDASEAVLRGLAD